MEEIDNKAEKRKDADIMKKYKAVFSEYRWNIIKFKTSDTRKYKEKK